ncbi:MAG: Rrf2 family transcriptional regulator [Candidatus Omnitrophota bacterium]
MRITTQGEYALRCILNIAKNGPDSPVAISRIVQEEDLPLDYVEQLLMKLRRHGLIKSLRGARGGYLLKKGPERISVKEVIEAVEGHVFEVICERKKNGDRKKCKQGEKCRIKALWHGLKKDIEHYLGHRSIRSLM